MSSILMLLLLIPYGVYPLFAWAMAQRKNPHTVKVPIPPGDYPMVDVVFAAYNEEKVIGAKLESLAASHYPSDRFRVWIGSDVSTDATDALVRSFSEKHPAFQLVRMQHRTGKSGIINALVAKGKGEIIVATDANIFFEPETLSFLVQAIQRGNALAGGWISYRDAGHRIQKESSIAQQESLYLNFENRLKQWESAAFHLPMGVEGGCYAIDRKAWQPIPPNTFMEDFFVTLQVAKKGLRIAWVPEARCTEDVSVDRSEEFQRKIRISLGNFQNLARFWTVLFTSPYPLGWVFFGHKVLRWVFPFVSLALLFVSIAKEQWVLPGLFAVIGFFWLWDTAEPQRPGIKRSIGHFCSMNMALVFGFFRYLRGVKSSVWQPTKREEI